MELQNTHNCDGQNMEIWDLKELKKHLYHALHKACPDCPMKVEIGFPDSPNPLCFFEIDGAIYAQGSFWSNYEYEIGAMITETGTEIFRQSGSFSDMTEACSIVNSFCERVRSVRSSG